MAADEDDAALEDWFAALAERTGTPKLGADEAATVLDLTRVVAHTSERRYAPLAAYVVGIALGQSEVALDPLARDARVREVLEAARDLAAPDAGPDAGGGDDG